MSGSRPSVASLRWRRSHALIRWSPTDLETGATLVKFQFDVAGGCRVHKGRTRRVGFPMKKTTWLRTKLSFRPPDRANGFRRLRVHLYGWFDQPLCALQRPSE